MVSFRMTMCKYTSSNSLLQYAPTDDIGSFTAQLNIPPSVLCDGTIYIADDHGNSLVLPVEQCTG